MIIKKINKQPVEPRELIEVVAGPQDAKLVEDLQQHVRKNAMKDKNGEPVFAADSKEFIESIINSKRGIVVCYFTKDEEGKDDFVGFFELTCPDDPNELEEEYHISQYLPNADISNMGVAESFAVMPKFQGNHLQVQMFRRMEEIAASRGITSLIGTVHPENIYSCASFDASNYQTVVQFEAHGGPRYLKYKEIPILDRDNNESHSR